MPKRHNNGACQPRVAAQSAYLLVVYTFLPSGEATRPLKVSPPDSFFCARPAMGVLQEPSRVPRNDLSHWMAILVSSWFREASSFCVAESSSLHAIPIAPCTTQCIVERTTHTLAPIHNDIAYLAIRHSYMSCTQHSNCQSTSLSRVGCHMADSAALVLPSTHAASLVCQKGLAEP